MEIRYSVDRIIDNIIVIENIENSQLEFLFSESLDFEVEEGDILVFKNNMYFNDIEAKKERLEQIREKFNRVRRKK